MPGWRIWKSVHYSLKCQQVALFRKMCFDSTYSDLKTLRQVPLYLSDLEMNWTSSFLVQSDELAIVLHLLAPVGTVVMPAEHEVVRRQSPTPGASRYFPLSHRLMQWSTSGRTRVWHVNPRFQWTDRLRWSACNPGLQHSVWAHNLYEVVIPSGHHSAEAVDLRRVVQIAGRLIQEKARKECQCVVSGSARCTTLRDEDEVWMFLGETQTSHAGAWRSMCDCTLWQQVKTSLCDNCAWENVVRVSTRHASRRFRFLSTCLFSGWFGLWFCLGGFRVPALPALFWSPRSFFELFQRVRHHEQVVSEA